jgi:hypothetical protein
MGCSTRMQINLQLDRMATVSLITSSVIERARLKNIHSRLLTSQKFPYWNAQLSKGVLGRYANFNILAG